MVFKRGLLEALGFQGVAHSDWGSSAPPAFTRKAQLYSILGIRIGLTLGFGNAIPWLRRSENH